MQPRPAHLSDDDFAVWLKFTDSPSFPGWTWRHDVTVGQQPELPEGTEAKWIELWRTLRLKRVDALGVKENELFVVELKPMGDVRGLGQCIVYRDCLERERNLRGRVHAALVCLACDPDVRAAARSAGVAVLELGS